MRPGILKKNVRITSMNYWRFLLFRISEVHFIEISFLVYLYNAVIPRIIYALLIQFLHVIAALWEIDQRYISSIRNSDIDIR